MWIEDEKKRHIGTTTTFVCSVCGKKTPVGLPFEMIVDCEIQWDCEKCMEN